MDIKRKIIKSTLDKVELERFLKKAFESSGYSHSDIRRTPMGMRITIYADRPGLVIGMGGKKIKEITEKLEKDFGLENPHLDVQEIKVPNLDAVIVAREIAKAMERGINWKRIGNIMIRRIMEAGATGAEIRISGKLGSARGRSERFVDGYLKYCGEPSKRLVDEGFASAMLKPGSVGVHVRIMTKWACPTCEATFAGKKEFQAHRCE
jgi:small subunit ribosomal protein S3